MTQKILILPGDGIGLEITGEVRVLEALKPGFEQETAFLGGAAVAGVSVVVCGIMRFAP
jgi:isocitrate/isopropylmalate dehydrogenase